MKNKNEVKTADGYTYEQVDEAAKVIQAYYTKLAERTAETNPKMSKDFNFIRLEMRNLRQWTMSQGLKACSSNQIPIY
jgi:hypothetical protein